MVRFVCVHVGGGGGGVGRGVCGGEGWGREMGRETRKETQSVQTSSTRGDLFEELLVYNWCKVY